MYEEAPKASFCALAENMIPQDNASIRQKAKSSVSPETAQYDIYKQNNSTFVTIKNLAGVRQT